MLAATHNQLYTITKNRARMHFHRGQFSAWDSLRRFVFVVAGTQSGKTSWGPWWLAREIDHCGPGDYIAATATYDLFKLKMLPELRHVFGMIAGGWEYKAGDRVLVNAKCDTRIILRSANVPGGLESATAKAAWLDECGQDAFRVESWEAVLRRLSLSGGRILGTTTPYNLGWLKTQVYDKWRAGDGEIDVIQFSSIMNPAFPVSEYEAARLRLPSWKFEMFYNGNFSRPAGLIYGDFDEAVHVVAPFHIPYEWPRYVGIDFGAINTALVWIAENPNNHTYFIYRESLAGEKTTAEHAAAALTFANYENVISWRGGAPSEQQQRWDWRAAGIGVDGPTVPDVEAGIDRIIELFKTRRLFVFNNLPGILDEIGTYGREVDDRGNPTEKIKDKDTFHRLDALRYGVQGFTDPACQMTTGPNPFEGYRG